MKLDGNLIPVSLGTVGAIPKEEETKTVSSPNFSSGNIVVTPTTGKVMTRYGTIRSIAVDDTHVYAGGSTTQTVRKIPKK